MNAKLSGAGGFDETDFAVLDLQYAVTEFAMDMNDLIVIESDCVGMVLGIGDMRQSGGCVRAPTVDIDCRQ